MRMLTKTNLILLSGIALIALGITGYFLYSKPKISSESQTTDQQSMKLEKQSDSDDLDSIEKDLDETSLTNVDKESVSIEQEIKSTN